MEEELKEIIEDARIRFIAEFAIKRDIDYKKAEEYYKKEFEV